MVGVVIKTNHGVASEINTYIVDSSRLLIKPVTVQNENTEDKYLIQKL